MNSDEVIDRMNEAEVREMLKSIMRTYLYDADEFMDEEMEEQCECLKKKGLLL